MIATDPAAGLTTAGVTSQGGATPMQAKWIKLDQHKSCGISIQTAPDITTATSTSIF